MKQYAMAIGCSLLFGCVSQPTVYVYGKYLQPDSRHALVEKLEKKSLNVKVNTFDFPASVTTNTLLYSLMLNDASLIDYVDAQVASSGYQINRTQGLTEGNHWYTKNSVALFLFPSDSDEQHFIFRADLTGKFISRGCQGITALELRNDGSFVFSGQPDESVTKAALTGTWRYRQYPYVELKSSDVDVAEHYFEISRFSERDQISDISFINLNVLSSYLMPAGCQFRLGL